MTNSQLPASPSKERLEKIVSWRETYGDDHNVVLPAKEAEALARYAMAGMEQEPVAYMCDGDDGREYNGHNEFSSGGLGIPLYAAPVVSEGDEILNDICDLFKIGERARTRSAIMTNIENTIDFAEKLNAIEREFFMVPGEPDDDYPDEEPEDECLVNHWGSTTAQYVEQFRAALKSISAPVAVPAPVVLPDDELINRKAFERFANNLGYSDASYFTTDTHPNYYDDDRINEMWCSWNACRAAMLNGGKS